jgi:hypothetical protein
MALNWATVTADHVRQACEAIRSQPRFRDRNAGLVIYYGENRLPAKIALREAYRLANGLTPDTEIKFSSGEQTLNRLKELGFRAERMGPATE